MHFGGDSPFRIMSLAALVRKDAAVARAYTASRTNVLPVPLGERSTVDGVGIGFEGELAKEAKVSKGEFVETHDSPAYWTRTGIRR